jgi:RimJ/RimL family protein N-acetyltransferase
MAFTLEPWSHGDFPLLVAANTEEMTRHLGGPETPEQLEQRQAKYLRLQAAGEARMFSVRRDGERVGSIGWWDSEWQDRPVHETGWFVLPAAQRTGVAKAAVALVVEDVREHAAYDRLYAFPDRDNAASNALCKTAGFTWDGEAEEEFRAATLHVQAWYISV